MIFFKAVDAVDSQYNSLETWYIRFIFCCSLLIDFAIINFISMLLTNIHLIFIYARIKIHGLRGQYFKFNDFILPKLHWNVSLYVNYKKTFLIVIFTLIVIYIIAARWKYKNVF